MTFMRKHEPVPCRGRAGSSDDFHQVQHPAAKTQGILFTTGTLIRVSVEALH